MLLDRIFMATIASIIVGMAAAGGFYHFGMKNIPGWIMIIALGIFSVLFAIWVVASIAFGVKEGEFQAALGRRIAFDEDAIARFSPFPADALKTAHSHLEREHARMTARRTTGLYLLASPAILATIIGLAQRSPQNQVLQFLQDVAKRSNDVDSFGFGILVAALFLGFLIGGFANNVRCETLGRLIFVVGEAVRRKKKN